MMLQVVKDLLIVSLFCALPKYDKLKLKALRKSEITISINL